MEGQTVNSLPFILSLPLKVTDHFKFTILFFLIGFILTCWFYLYLLTYKQNERKIGREIFLALFASIYFGIGSFLLMLSLGVNV